MRKHKYPKVGATLLRAQITYIKRCKPRNYNEERVTDGLNKCCDFYSECHCEDECKELQETWAGLLPPGREKTALQGSGKTEPGAWMQGKYHGTVVRTRVRPII